MMLLGLKCATNKPDLLVESKATLHDVSVVGLI